MRRNSAGGWMLAVAPALMVALLAGLAGGLGPLWTALLFVFAIMTGTATWLLFPEHSTGPAESYALPVPSMNRPPVRQPAELFEAVLGTMIDGVVVADSSMNLLYVNGAARELLEIGSRPVAGRLITEVSRSAPLQEVIETAFRTRAHQQTELQLQRQKLTLAVSVAPLNLDPAGGILIVLHDVTELRRLERMRREFVSNVSHELKTPLTSIQAYADTLLSGGLEDESHRRTFVDRIQEQADRLQVLILDLLRLARIEADDVAFEIRAVDVGDVVADCIDDRMDVASSKGLTLAMNAPPERVIARAEAEGLRTILSNLIENGINYTPAGGRVEVDWRVSDGAVRIAVRDTGVGIPKEHQARVFERFYRVDRARSRALGGTGLGLAIVKHLSQAFEGRVELESEQGRGSCFVVWLPLADETSTAKTP